ncbi:MAG: NAD(P)-dependent oxidoreductase [Armatimonadetes bacterium]|nr:NAD(P)-dependent oxidoreductase [Armatimonadota bacterium]
MKAIVTGGSGHIGRVVVRYLASNHEVINLDRVEPVDTPPGVEFRSADLLKLESAKSAIRDADAVVHLAAIPNPFNDPPERVLSVNVGITFNVIEAMVQNGIPRIVYGSSESASGFGVRTRDFKPLYLPIDEQHPSWPTESYGVSKVLCEEMLRSYSRTFGIEVVSLRYCWVWTEVFRDEIRAALESRRGGGKDLFCTHVAPEDVGQACDLGLKMSFAGRSPAYEMFYITAAETYADTDSLELVRDIYKDDPPPVRKPAYFADRPRTTLYDLTKAYQVLGYRPKLGWRDYVDKVAAR